MKGPLLLAQTLKAVEWPMVVSLTHSPLIWRLCTTEPASMCSLSEKGFGLLVAQT